MAAGHRWTAAADHPHQRHARTWRFDARFTHHGSTSMRRTSLLITSLVVMSVIAGAAPTAAAQKPPTAGEERGGPEQPPKDPFARLLFPPELIMQHQSELGLTDAQRSTLMTAVQQAQGKFVETQFKLAGEGEKLARLLQASSIDESQALEQVDRETFPAPAARPS